MWCSVIFILIVLTITNLTSIIGSPLRVYKFVNRYYEISPVGKVEGTTSVKLEVRGNGRLIIEDVVMFIDPSSITLVGNTIPPSDMSGDQLLTRIAWDILVKKSLMLHYQARSSVKVIDGYCYVSVNSKPVNFTRVRGTFLVKAKEEDTINITYVIRNSMPLFISKNGTLFKVVLPAILTLSFDETKLIVEDVDPKPNVSSKLGSSKILIWFVLLKNELSINVLIQIKSLGPWKEIRVEPLNVKIDFSTEKYIERIDSTIKELKRQLDEIREYSKALNKTLDFYTSYSVSVGNTTKELKELGLFLKDNASKVFMRQYYNINHYKDKLKEITKYVSFMKENVLQIITLLKEIEEEIIKVKEDSRSTTFFLNITERLVELSKRYNVSKDLILTYLSIIETLRSSLNSSKSSAELIISFIKSIQRLLKMSYEKIEDIEYLFEKLIAEMESYSKLQYHISNSLYSLGATLVNMSELMERVMSEFNDTIKMYEEKISSLKEKEYGLIEAINDLTEIKMGLIALEYVKLIESHVFTEASVKILYNQSAVVFELDEFNEREEAYTHETLEVDMGSFHITGIGVSTISKSNIPEESIKVLTELDVVYFLIFVILISIGLITFFLIRRLRKRAQSELLNRIEELIQLIEKELKKT